MEDNLSPNPKSFNINDKPRDDNVYDEVIDIRLPREQYEILRMMIKREQAYSYWTGMLKTSWVWIVGGGILTIFLLWDRIAALTVKV